MTVDAGFVEANLGALSRSTDLSRTITEMIQRSQPEAKAPTMLHARIQTTRITRL